MSGKLIQVLVTHLQEPITPSKGKVPGTALTYHVTSTGLWFHDNKTEISWHYIIKGLTTFILEAYTRYNMASVHRRETYTWVNGRWVGSQYTPTGLLEVVTSLHGELTLKQLTGK